MKPRTRTLLLTLSAVLMTTLLAGCATRSVTVVTDGDVVRLNKPVKARVSTTSDGVTWKDAGKMTIPAGWFATPGPK